MSNDEKAGCCLGGFTVLIVGIVVACTFGGCDSTYGEGSREGYVQKLSHKGWWCKSWEGELAMQGLRQGGDAQAMSGNIFEFSVEDGSPCLQDLQDLNADELVRLRYRQVYWSPWNRYFTSYRVVSVEHIKHDKELK